MVKMDIIYEGGLHCRLTHGPSGTVISTDAPKDNHGKGEAFSPTDLVAAALGSCMITTMALFAERHQVPLEGTKIEVTKEMIADPVRRIGKLGVYFHFPKGIPHDQRSALERAALACPVHKSLDEKIIIEAKFDYPD